MKILVVDDMALSRMATLKVLAKLGHKRAELAENGEVAWEKLLAADQAGSPYDLVFSDWMMPVLDGIGLLKRINSGKLGSCPPMILATAESDIAQVGQAVKQGIAAYVRKPLTVDSVRAALERVATSKAGDSK